MWETDVGVSSDGVLILFHDDSLVRTTDAESVFPWRAPWTTATFTYSELQMLDLGSWFLKTDPFGQIAAGGVSQDDLISFRTERIPTLEDALVFTRDANWRINIELKRLPAPMEKFPVVEQVLDLIDRIGIDSQQLVLSSFCHAWLEQISRRRPDIQIQALIGLPEETTLNWGDLAFSIYNARYSLLTERKVRELVAKGVQLNVWPVNDEKDMLRFMAAGVSGIITDFPQRLANLLKNR